jgi:putative salt-induced outer membrane protein YdiY
MLRFCGAAAVLTLLATPALAQTLDMDLRQSEERLAQALTTKDAGTLETLLATDFVMRGTPDVTRAVWLKNALTMCWGDRFEISDFSITRQATDLAVVSVVLTTHLDPVSCEPATIRSLLTDVWVRQDEGWRLAVRHSGPANPAVAAQFDKTPPPPPRWERTAELSLLSTGGNTDTLTIGAGGSIIWRPAQWTTHARTVYVRSSTEDAVTAESLVAELRQARVLSPRADAFGRAEYLVDRFAGIDHRTTIDGGLGWLLLDDGRRSLKVDGALGMTRESRLRGEDLTFASGSGTGHFIWKITPTATFSERFALTTDISEAGNWRLQNGASLTVTVTRILSARLGHELKRINRPVPGFGRTDTTLSAALVARF